LRRFLSLLKLRHQGFGTFRDLNVFILFWFCFMARNQPKRWGVNSLQLAPHFG
jgi:hypothetical protein